jgi:dTDP-4-dehydrorhamnose 3,5-epimerase
MTIFETHIPGVVVIESPVFQDTRGSFSRLFCEQTLQKIIGPRTVIQINQSQTRSIGAVRGLHYQNPPYAEMKIVRCLRGRVFDVAVDLRQDSPTFLKWTAIELSPENNRSFVIPEGCAHGFQVLEANSQLLYLHTEFYNPEAEDALRFDEPMIDVKWPLVPTDLSSKDLNHPHLNAKFKGIIL